VTPSSPVLILGAHSDIGQALARAYAASGRPVILAARNAERLESDAADIRIRHEVDVRIVEADICDRAGHRAFLDGLVPFPCTVITVVGLLGDQTVARIDPQAAEQIMRTNYVDLAVLIGEIVNRMEARGHGTIVGISSVAGERGRASNYVYGSAKAGYTAFLSGLRNRFNGTAIRVITVKPGFVDTSMTEGMKLPPALTAKPDEVAQAILRADTGKRDVVYVKPIWQIIMLVIRLLPEAIFKRLKL
jgi:decaprenylphospho-beta-D-erythro-pentofuranosid-2-ulose 2-reductase